MTEKHVRTRFAPSPTGYMHVGNLRTALFTYLIAKANEGVFILRIEDTDLERQVEGALEIIYNTLKTVGLTNDEGPDVGGDFGPYIQTERKDLYRKHADMLIEKGHAYPCFCSTERLDALRKEQGLGFMYDRHCKNLSPAVVAEKLKNNEPHVVRQFIPDEGETKYHDLVYGTITFQNKELGDQILLKSDGLPTYNFANVVDDHLMEITHVVRGNEYLSSAPKYSILYDSFGWKAPAYVHLPLVLNETGDKLSKRKGDSTFEDLIEAGFLPAAILNFMALLGWSPKNSTEEFFTLEELIQVFDVAGISKSPAVFDMNKLRWMNGEYFKKMDPEQFYNMAKPFIEKNTANFLADYKALAKTLQARIFFLKDIDHMLDFVGTLPTYTADLFIHPKMKTTAKDAKGVLEALCPSFENISWEKDALHSLITGFATDNELKNGQVMWPIRSALSGKEETPMGAIDLLLLFGKEESLKRLNIGIDIAQRS